jgi:hypothetical protein
MFAKLVAGISCLIGVHTLVWFSTNLQFVNEKMADKSLEIAIGLGIPISLLAYFGTRYTYQSLENSAWAVRFVAFGTSYLVFPFLTWWMLKETMFTPKTLTCIILSLTIVAIQIFWK